MQTVLDYNNLFYTGCLKKLFGSKLTILIIITNLFKIKNIN